VSPFCTWHSTNATAVQLQLKYHTSLLCAGARTTSRGSAPRSRWRRANATSARRWVTWRKTVRKRQKGSTGARTRGRTPASCARVTDTWRAAARRSTNCKKVGLAPRIWQPASRQMRSDPSHQTLHLVSGMAALIPKYKEKAAVTSEELVKVRSLFHFPPSLPRLPIRDSPTAHSPHPKPCFSSTRPAPSLPRR
jgi:hypothetical protein